MPLSPRLAPQQAGAGLPEVLIVVLVLAILCAIALPSLRETLARLRAETLRGQLVSVLSTARSTAITQRRVIGACPSSDGSTCGGDWSHGWLLYVAAPPSAPDGTPIELLLVEQRSRVALQAAGNRDRVEFRADGRTRVNNLTIQICMGPALHSEVVVSVPGRVRSQRPSGPASCSGN